VALSLSLSHTHASRLQGLNHAIVVTKRHKHHPQHPWGILDAKDRIVDFFIGVLQMPRHGRTIAQSLPRGAVTRGLFVKSRL